MFKNQISISPFQEPVRIGGTPAHPKCYVRVNDVRVKTDGAAQTIGVFVGVFLAFNLVHSHHQEATVEALEGFLGLRKTYSKLAARNLLRAMNFL